MSLRARILVCGLAGLLVILALQVRSTQAQSTIAQIGASSPLPVYVVNQPLEMLPEGFDPGTNWQFTTWTTPSVFTWTAAVNRINGPWANLTITAQDGSSTTRWYYVPAMPGSWEKR